MGKNERTIMLAVAPYIIFMSQFMLLELIGIRYPSPIFITLLFISGIIILISIALLHIEAFLKANYLALIISIIYQTIIFVFIILGVLNLIGILFFK